MELTLGEGDGVLVDRFNGCASSPKEFGEGHPDMADAPSPDGVGWAGGEETEWG